MEPAPAPLTGKALLQRFSELAHLPRREKARQCGYYQVNKDDQVKVNLTEFYDALLAAGGMRLAPEGGSKETRGRDRTYRVSVHKNGQIVIGAAYTKAMGLKPGDEFEIKLGYKHIRLIKLTEHDSSSVRDLNAHFASPRFGNPNFTAPFDDGFASEADELDASLDAS
jgi:hypothetical protein